MHSNQQSTYKMGLISPKIREQMNFDPWVRAVMMAYCVGDQSYEDAIDMLVEKLVEARKAAEKVAFDAIASRPPAPILVDRRYRESEQPDA